MRHPIIVVVVSIVLSAALAGCFDTRGGGRRPPTDAGPDIILLDSGPRATCGDGTCASSESCSSCEMDCGSCTGICGDGTCASSESCSSCEADCGRCTGSCGDGTCSSSETCSSCERDCGPCAARCGDGTCASSESCSSCELDCGPCTGSCRSIPVPPYSGPVPCSSATRTCAEGCPDGACIGDCLMADPNPDCYGCVQQNLISCFISAGCEEEWDCYAACYEDAGCTTGTCPACDAETTAWDDCVTAVGDACGGDWVSCLP